MLMIWSSDLLSGMLLILLFDLATVFLVKDLGRLSYFLGLEIDYSDPILFLSQRKYIKNLLVRCNMFSAKPMPPPMIASLKLSQFDVPQFDVPQFDDCTLFRSIVEGLQYLSLTQLDIAFAVNKVCHLTDLMLRGSFDTSRPLLIMVCSLNQLQVSPSKLT